MILENIESLTVDKPKGTAMEASFITGGMITRMTYPDGTIQDATIMRGDIVFTKFNRPIAIDPGGKVSFVDGSAPGAIPANTEIRISKAGVEILTPNS